MPRRRAPQKAGPEHAELLRYATAAGMSLEAARIALARQRWMAAVQKLRLKMEGM